MRNLKLLRNLTIHESLLSTFSKYYVVNESSASRSTLIFGISECLKIYQLIIDDNLALKNTFVTDLSQHIDCTEKISIIECNYIFNELYIIVNTGHLVIISVANLENIVVVVQELNTGPLNFVSWSPDLERTVLINSDDLLFVLSIVNDDFEKLIDISLQGSFDEQNKFVNVGWGKVETQFRGSEGKFSVTSTKETPEDNLNDDKVQVCWKNNSTTFAVSYICRVERIRKVKIFNQDGVLQNITKSIHGLQSVMDWCPTRNLITCVQTLPNKQVLCFLEENALRHGEFQLPENIKITRLYWNNSGNILACSGTGIIDGEFIALWTTSNYKWYLKQNLQFRKRIFYMQWDHSFPNRLHVFLESGIYRMYEWLVQITESSECNCYRNLSLVAVINNHYINFTPYRQVCQPPSIFADSFEVPSNSVNAVIFPSMSSSIESDSLNCNSTILYLSNNQLLLLQYEDCSNHVYSFTFGDPDLEIEFLTPLELSAWLWLLPSSLFFCWSRPEGNYFCVSQLDVDTKSAIMTKTFKMNSLIMTIVTCKNDVIVHCEDGKVFVYRDDELHSMSLRFVEPCHRLQSLNKNTIIALSENRNLYVNENIKWRDVVSFYWKTPFLILVTMDNQLLLTKVDFDGKGVRFNEVFGRSIEPKSYLVTIVDDQVILETERGNLETITPRPFSIFKIEKLLENFKIVEVFKLLRKQRINLNLIYDNEPLYCSVLLLKMIKKVEPSYVLNFIMELENENVAKRMFPWKYGNKIDEENKVQKICNDISVTIKERKAWNQICPLIAALVRQNKLTEAANYAIQYNEISTLCHLSDAITVYKAALASYDLECALKIIQHSKLDPSEYLPFIHELQEMDENYRKFKICDYLENYPEALKLLSECGDEKFEACVAYVRKHKLYTSALRVYNDKYSGQTNALYLKIVTIVAEYFYENRQYEEAAIVFEKAGLYEKALICYLFVGDMFSAVSTVKCMRCDESKQKEMFYNIYDELRKKEQYEDAGFIAYNFIGDNEKAVQNYLAAKKYCNSINVAKSFNNEQIIKNTLLPCFEEETKTIIENFVSDLNLISKYAERLIDIRTVKKHQDKVDEDDQMSFISETTDNSDSDSVSSFNSGSSSAYSIAKRARKRERKLWNLKPGNPREERSVLNALREIIQNGQKQYSTLVPDLLRALVKIDNLQLANRLKTEYEVYLARIDKIEKNVWPVENVKEVGGFKDIQNTCPPDITITGWELKIF